MTRNNSSGRMVKSIEDVKFISVWWYYMYYGKTFGER